jgi:hypothetical protein
MIFSKNRHATFWDHAVGETVGARSEGMRRHGLIVEIWLGGGESVLMERALLDRIRGDRIPKSSSRRWG